MMMEISPTHRHVPGSFAILPPELDIKAGSNAQIFQPPRTPAGAASASLIAFRVDQVRQQDGSNCGSRKRQRQSSPTVPAATNAWADASVESSSFLRSAGPSPPPYVNTTYLLDGGVSRPSLTSGAALETDDEAREVHFRRRWSAGTVPRATGRSPRSRASPATGGADDTPSRSHSRDAQSKGWGSFVFSVVGGVAATAGKMWQFCRGSAFRGFYAGGGRGYEMALPDSRYRGDAVWQQDVDEGDGSAAFQRESTPIPGQYPEDSMIPYSSDRDSNVRPSKRLHTDSGNGWVMVPRSSGSDAQASSPRVSRRRPPNKPNSSRPVASRAGSRRSILPVPRRAATVSSTGSPTQLPNRPQPLTPAPRSPKPSHQFGSSPVSPEIQRYAAKLRREERETDASMRKLNRQLKDMIREGREALGTRVEVQDGIGDDDMEDEGFAEGRLDQSSAVW